MKYLIVGNKGQVGTELTSILEKQGHPFSAYDFPEMDITNLELVQSIVDKDQPDILINCAAYTAVDKAEEEKEAAFAVNADGPGNLAKACAKANIPLIHISTDYVFNGTKEGEYYETDQANPIAVYGESKWVGEELVRKNLSNHIIIRTSWVFSSHGNNFVKTMLRLSQEREELRVVADQRGCPTSAREIARAIYTISQSQLENKYGAYHFCQPEPTTWHGFASETIAQAKNIGFPVVTKEIEPIETSQYPTPATRPANSVLNCDKICTNFGLTIPNWKDSLLEALNELSN